MNNYINMNSKWFNKKEGIIILEKYILWIIPKGERLNDFLLVSGTQHECLLSINLFNITLDNLDSKIKPPKKEIKSIQIIKKEIQLFFTDTLCRKSQGTKKKENVILYYIIILHLL